MLIMSFTSYMYNPPANHNGGAHEHKRTAWGCRGCGRIPNAEKLAIIWAKIFKFWAKYTATFACK